MVNFHFDSVHVAMSGNVSLKEDEKIATWKLVGFLI